MAANGLVAWILAFVMAGGAAAVVGSWAAPDDSASTFIDVPVGRLGDALEYATTRSWSESTGGKTDEGARSDRLKVVVGPVARIPDKTGAMHRTIQITTFDERWLNSTPLRSTPGFNGKPHETAEFVHLGTRDVVAVGASRYYSSNWRARGNTNGDATYVPYTTDESSTNVTIYGPRPDANACYGDVPAWLAKNHSLVRFQGTRLAAGTEFGADEGRLTHVYSTNTGWIDCLSPAWQANMTTRTWVEGASIGSDLLAVRRTFALKYEYKVGAETELGLVTGVEALWFAPGFAYPVRAEGLESGSYRSENKPFSWAARWNTSLVGFTPGGEAVSWGPRDSADPYRPAPAFIERSSSSFPQDGTGSRLVFPLAKALESIEADPLLANFTLWRQLHPSAKIVGLALIPSPMGVFGFTATVAGPGKTPVYVWLVVYADLSRNDGRPPAYGIASHLNLETGVISNQDRGELRRPTGNLPDRQCNLRLEDLPAQPITFAAAERTWRTTPSAPAGDWVPNGASWGCGMGGVDPTKHGCCYQVSGTATGLGRLSIKFLDQLDAPTHVGPSRVALQAHQYHLLNFNVTSGNIVTGTYRGGEAALPLIPAMGSVGAAHQGNARSPAPPSFELPAAALAAASTLLVVLAAYFYPLLKFFAGHAIGALPGYAKLNKAELLNNKIRESMLQLIKADPGITPPEIQGHVQAGWSTIVYHLGVLEKNLLVSSLIDGRHKRFFPVGQTDHSKRGQLAALRNERTKQLYDIVIQQPGAIQTELVRRLGISQPSTAWHLKRLEAVGLVGHDQQGRKLRYYANPKEMLVDAYDAKAAVEVA